MNFPWVYQLSILTWPANEARHLAYLIMLQLDTKRCNIQPGIGIGIGIGIGFGTGVDRIGWDRIAALARLFSAWAGLFVGKYLHLGHFGSSFFGFPQAQGFPNLLRPFHSSLRDSDLNFSINIKSIIHIRITNNKGSREWGMLIWWKFVCVCRLVALLLAVHWKDLKADEEVEIRTAKQR